MKRLILGGLWLSVLISCGRSEHLHDEVLREEHYHGEESLIELSDEQAKRFGVTVDTVFAGEFASVINASGVVERSIASAATATAPISGIVKYRDNINVGVSVAQGSLIADIDPTAVSGGDGNRAAKAALEASRREVERLTPLYNDRLVTAADYNSAVAAYEEAKAAYAPSASDGHVRALITGKITDMAVRNGSYVNAGDPIAIISEDNRLTLHAEVAPELYGQLSKVRDARIGNYTLGEHGGRVVGVSSENGYACIFFEFDNDGAIAPGSGVGVKLLGEITAGVISLPLSAVSEQQGEYFVYLLHSPGHYERRRVVIGASDGLRVEIVSGLKGGEHVVSSSAVTVRLAESSGKIPEGHSHSH